MGWNGVRRGGGCSGGVVWVWDGMGWGWVEWGVVEWGGVGWGGFQMVRVKAEITTSETFRFFR